EPLVRREHRARREREQRVLVDDPLVERGRLDEDEEVLAAELIEPAEVGRRATEHLGVEEVRALLPEQAAQLGRRAPVRLYVVRTPHGAVLVVPVEVRRHEVEGDVRRVRPVEEAGRQPVVLAEGEPVPHRVDRHVPARRVLAEVAHQVPLELVRVAAEPDEAGRQVAVRSRHAPEGEVGAEAAERLVPRPFVELLLELDPARDMDVGHYAFLSRYRSWCGFPFAPSGTNSTTPSPAARRSCTYDGG